MNFGLHFKILSKYNGNPNAIHVKIFTVLRNVMYKYWDI